MTLIDETWRLEPIADGPLAWFYLRPYAAGVAEHCNAVTAQGYTITEECQSIVDETLGGCVRYLLQRPRPPRVSR